MPKRTKKISKLGMDGSIIQHILEFNTAKPKVYKPGIIEEYIKERNRFFLTDPKVSEETKQQILKENRI